MRRTQLYLEDDVWKALHVKSRESGVSISELVRAAVRDRYCEPASWRRDAMRAFVGIWQDRNDIADGAAHVRGLRKGKRLDRLAQWRTS